MTQLSLCLICRNNAATIRPCLESIRPWVDEMVVVDTGSTDETPEIAAELGARMGHFSWCDDFSAARNESLRLATGRWLFWMDSDDTISPEDGRRLRELAYCQHRPQTLGYVMRVKCPGERGDDMTIVDHVKMFRNHPEIRFEFPLHEQVLLSIRRLGGAVERANVAVTHSGADHSEEGRKRKYERDIRILNTELQRRPDHPFVLFNLGMTHTDMEEHELAINYLQLCIEVSGSRESHLRKAYALLTSALASSNRREDVESTCLNGLAVYPNDPELLFRYAMTLHNLQRLDEAEAAYLRLLTESTSSDEYFSSVDPGITSYKARHNLGVVYEAMGRPDLAEVQWRNAVIDGRPYGPSMQLLHENLRRNLRMHAADLVGRCAN